MSATLSEPETIGRREFARLLRTSVKSIDRWRDRLPAPLPVVGPPYPNGLRVRWLKSVAEEFARNRQGAACGS